MKCNWIGVPLIACPGCGSKVFRYVSGRLDCAVRWAFWKEHGLEKFILLVAHGVDDRNVLDAKREYEREKKIRCLSEKRAALTSRWGTSKKGLIC